MADKAYNQELVKGRYRLEDLLGTGGMGVVYRAWDRLKRKYVAFKKVRIDTGENYSELAQTIDENHTTESVYLSMAQEFQTLATLRHPNIISVLDYGFDKHRQPWFTMALVEDGKTFLEAGCKRPLAEKVDMIVQMVRAVAYLHRRGIIHRDLKPENVLVTDSDVKLLDFGLASKRDQIEATVSISGTVGYLAPEVLKGELTTYAADYFSVGVMVCELLTEEPFYPDYDVAKIYQYILSHEPATKQFDLPEPLAELVYALTHKDPNQRLTDPQQIVSRLAPFAPDKDITVETSATRESFLQAASFVGRKVETMQLVHGLRMAASERGSGWLIGGESGVGKTRLVDEIRVRAMVDGALVLQGQALPDNPGEPYALWSEIVSQLLLLKEPDDLTASVLKTVVPDIASLLGREIADPPELDGPAARQRLHSTITNLFNLKDGFVLLILEDLHWDENSIDILAQLTRVMHSFHLLVVATYRTDEAADLPNRLPNMNPIQLPRFTKEEMRSLSREMLGPIAKSQKLQQVLEAETEGNAFFLIELVRELAEVTGGLSKISSADLPKKVLPKGVASIIERRLDQVPPEAQPLLKYAAIGGRQLDLKLLEQINQSLKSSLQVKQWLAICADAAVLEISNGDWRFSHEKIREGLIESLKPNELVQLHEKMAQTIMSIYPNQVAHAAALVHHLRKAGNSEQERDFAKQAGQYAQERFMNRDALEFYSRAIELTPPDNRIEQFDLWLRVEEIQNLLAERDQQEISIEHLNGLADFINRHKGGDFAHKAKLRLGRYQIAKGQFNQAILTSQAILEANLDQGSTTQIEALRQLGEANMRLGNYEQSIAILDQLIETTREQNEPLMMGEGYQQMGEALINSKRFREAVPFLEEAQQIFSALNLPQKEARIYNNMGIVSQARGKMARSNEHWVKSQLIYRNIGDRLGNAKILTNLCALNLDVGDFASAMSFGEQGLKVCQELSNEFGECLNLLNLAIINAYLKRSEFSEIYCHASIYMARNIDNPHLVANAHRELGLILTYQNRLREAEEAYKTVIELAEGIDQPVLQLEAQAELAQLYMRMGESEKAEEIVEPLLTFLAEGNRIDAAIHPFRLYMICYLMMRIRDHGSANLVLGRAYNELVSRANRLKDVQKREYYLSNITEHRQIVQAYENMNLRSI